VFRSKPIKEGKIKIFFNLGMCVDPQLQVGTSKNDASLGQIRKLSSFLMHPDYV
jgi:hypothetical protein